MPAVATVSSAWVQPILALAKLVGAPAEQIAQAAGISIEALADRDCRVPLSAIVDLMEGIERATQDSAFGIHLAEAFRRRPENVLALAVASSPTLGDAFRRAARYTRILNDASSVDVLVTGDVLHLRYRLDPPWEPHPFGPQIALGLLCLIGRDSVGDRFRLERATFRHPAPRAADEYARVFQCPVAFRQAHDELLLDAAVLSEPMPKADPALCEHLDRHLDRMLAREPAESELLQRVRRAIGEDVRSGLPDIEVVAGRLHMSGRSLQRRLRDAGTSFQKLLDQVRHELSLRYLEENMSLAEVAFLLGFSEPSNFHRAFKRWTGETPAEARTKLRRDGGSAIA